MARANHKATTGRSSESNSRTSARSTDIPDPADLISQIIAAAAHAPQGRAVARLEVKFDLATQGLCSLLVELEKSVGPELFEALDRDTCQAIVFGETSVLELTGTTTAANLADARKFIAGVAYKRNGDGVATPLYPSEAQLKIPFVKRAWDACGKAADDAVNYDVKTCKNFVIWYSDDQGKTPSRKPKEIKDNTWPYDETSKITGNWGPFKSNELAASNIYVIKYCGVA
jgi:hypothetical protein